MCDSRPRRHRPRRPSLVAAAALFVSGTPAAAGVIDFVMTIDGDQETPAVDTAAAGTGTATLDPDTNLLSWAITYAGLSGPLTVSHFHGPAPLCAAAAPVLTISDGGAASGVLTGSAVVSDQQADDLLAGLWYVNLHTALNPPGEIRGQVVPGPLVDPLPDVPGGDVHLFLETVATGLTAPNWATFAPGDFERLFVSDQNGILWAIDLATGVKTVFLDVSPLLVDLGVFGPGSFDERGLLGVAFHPDYQDNGLLYTYTSEHVFKPADFSTMPPGVLPDHRSVIREWQVPDPADPGSVVDPTTARALMRIDQPQFNHNAGAVNFGPDGMLYVALGDGGGADDKDGQTFIGGPLIGHGCIGNGADPSTILGSVIRIDPAGSNSANGAYGIPADNPFVGMAGFVPEIYAYGFRNPFRFSFDTLTGDLLLADVGQNDVEEVNVVVAGGNYGWNHAEGSFVFVANGNDSGYVTDAALDVPAGLIGPIAEYDHDDGIAIIGGFVYRGEAIPALQGRYVFGEFARTFSNDARLFYLDENDQVVEPIIIGQQMIDEFSLLGMGSDASGELYALVNTTGVPSGDTGVVLRISPLFADFDADGLVGITDFVLLVGAWGQTGGPEDLDHDGIVGIGDFLLLLGHWG